MAEIVHEIDLIGLSTERTLTLREAKRAFRRKSHTLLPEKALGAPNAHSRFEELNAAFVKVLHYLRDNNGERIDEIIPGQVDVKKAMFVINIKKGSVPFWKRVIRSVYPTVIIGAQKKSNFIPSGQGRAVRFVVYWRGGTEGQTLQQMKVNLILYENELLQVSGSSYFIWTMDNYQDIARRVDEAMLDYQRSEDEGVVTEDFSESRGSSETKEVPEERGGGKCNVVRCEEPKCQAMKKFDNIMKYLSELDEEMSSKCSDLKSCIESLESDFTQQLQELTVSLERNEERYSEDHRLTQEKITAISEKVYETRQIISGASATSKVSKVAGQVVATDKARQKIIGSPHKGQEGGGREGGGRKVSRHRQGPPGSPEKSRSRRSSRSSSPRKKDYMEVGTGEERRSRSRSKSSFNPPTRKSSRSSARVIDVHEIPKIELENNEEDYEEGEEFDDESNGSSVSLDV